jgi:hypothetical protein
MRASRVVASANFGASIGYESRMAEFLISVSCVFMSGSLSPPPRKSFCPPSFAKPTEHQLRDFRVYGMNANSLELSKTKASDVRERCSRN